MLLNCGVGEDSWESLGLQEIQPVHPKRNQSWIFIGRTDAEAEAPILWPPDAKDWLTGKNLERLKAGEGGNRGWDGWMVSQTWWTWVWVNSGVGDGQGGLVCCSPWDCKELDMTERLDWTELKGHWYFPGSASGKESACQCRRHKRWGFNPWVRKIPWRRKWQPTLVFLPGEPHGQRSLVGYSL